MQKLIFNMEKKFGKYAISNLINYFLMMYIAATVVDVFLPYLYPLYLALDFDAIRAGQVWRLVTFVLAPGSLSGFISIFLFVIMVYLYYLFGHSLENVWGVFRFNLFMFSGVIFTVLGEFILYIFAGHASFDGGLTYLYQSMFFAFCTLFPDESFLLYFVFPIKAKYLAAIDGIFLFVTFIQYFTSRQFAYCAAMIVSMLNLLIFFWLYKGGTRGFTTRYKTKKRATQFKRQTQMSSRGVGKHKCAICGRTDISNPELSFRFCSKCDGNYEYCDEHLFTHTHINKTNSNS